MYERLVSVVDDGRWRDSGSGWHVPGETVSGDYQWRSFSKPPSTRGLVPLQLEFGKKQHGRGRVADCLGDGDPQSLWQVWSACGPAGDGYGVPNSAPTTYVFDIGCTSSKEPRPAA